MRFGRRVVHLGATVLIAPRARNPSPDGPAVAFRGCGLSEYTRLIVSQIATRFSDKKNRRIRCVGNYDTPKSCHDGPMDTPNPATLPLRNEILNACGHCNVNIAAQALVDSLMILLIAAAPDVDAAERAVRAVGADMADNIRRAYAEYYGMREGLTQTRQ